MIVKSKDGRYFNVEDDVLAKCEVDAADLPAGAAFGDELSDEDLDAVAGGGTKQFTRTRTAAMGVRG